MYSTRFSNIRTSQRIRTFFRQQNCNTRVVLYADNTYECVDSKGTKENFIRSFKKDAVNIHSVTLLDGTFVNLYIHPESVTDCDYILNVGASRLRMDVATNVDITADPYFEHCLFGHVLFQRVDEDGLELGIDEETFIDIFIMYKIQVPTKCIF